MGGTALRQRAGQAGKETRPKGIKLARKHYTVSSTRNASITCHSAARSENRRQWRPQMMVEKVGGGVMCFGLGGSHRVGRARVESRAASSPFVDRHV